MFKYCNSLYLNLKIYAHNLIHKTDSFNYPKTELFEKDEISLTSEEIKLLRLNTLLYIKQCKNTFFKYTNIEKFNSELYNSFFNDDNFDGGDTGIDDDDNIRIFDKYILDYIKNRNDIMTYLQCKNQKINIVSKLSDLKDFTHSEVRDILFVIDMSDKDIFNYCLESKRNIKDCNVIKNIILSLIFKFNGEFINIKLNTSKSNQYHPHILLESSLNNKLN
mgnify:CR=1 FL=1